MISKRKLACPACKSELVQYHCQRQHVPCGWIICLDCGGYGFLDGSRWAVKAK